MISTNQVVAIVGMCGSGKSIAASVFTKNGWYKIHFGQITMDELKKRGLEVSEQNERMVREDLRNIHGDDAYAKLLLPIIRETLLIGDVVLDGLYSFSEYRLLSSELGGVLKVLAVISDRKKRYDRLCSRDIRPLNNIDAESRDYAEIENLDKGGPIAIADYFILNNSTKEVFEEDVYSFINNIFCTK